MKQNTLYMVVPCYNEEAVLPETIKRLTEKLQSLIQEEKISDLSKIVFVDDGSKDTTWQMIAASHHKDPMVCGIKLSRNRGHQNALLAGLMTVRSQCDMVISMDADLQDDVAAISAMVDRFHAGFDIVYGVRNERKTDTYFKKATAEGFYKLMRRMGVESVYNHADFRLMSARALEGLASFKEVNLFLRGMVPMVGFSSDVVYYERAARYAGESKYPLKKMLQFAIEGITSLSIEPIRMITSLGVFIFLVSIITIVYSLVRYFTGHTIQGWTTTVLSVWAIGGLIMISLGVIGEYIGKIYMETKNRPRYIVETYLNDNGKQVHDYGKVSSTD